MCTCVCVHVLECLLCVSGCGPLTARPLPIHKYGTLFSGPLQAFPLPEHLFLPAHLCRAAGLAHSSRAGEGVFFPRKPALNIPMAAQGTLCPAPILASSPPVLVLWAVTSGSCVHGVLKCGTGSCPPLGPSTGRDPIRRSRRPHRGPENAC